jgi:hypothetical protein
MMPGVQRLRRSAFYCALPLLDRADLTASCGPWTHPPFTPPFQGYLSDPALRQKVETYRDSVTPVKALRYTVSLDDPPSTRWHHIAPLFKTKAKAITKYFDEFLPPVVVPILERIAADIRSFFPDEYAAEMEANAKDLNLSVGEIVLVNLI